MSIRKVASLLETPTISYISLIRALTWIKPNILTFHLIIWFFQLQARCRTHVHFYVNKNRDHSFLLIDKYDTFNFNVTTFSRPVQHTFITLLHQIRSLPTHLEKINHFDECFFQFPISFFFLTINFNPLWKKERAYFFQVCCNKGLKLYLYSKGSLSHPAISRQLHVNAAMDSRG